MALVIAKKSATAPYTKGKSEKESLMEITFGKSGIKIREALAKALDLKPEDGVWMATDVVEKGKDKGKVTTVGLFKTTDADDFAYSVQKNLTIKGKDIEKAFLDLTGLETIEGSLANFTVDVENPEIVKVEDETTKAVREIKVYTVKLKEITEAKKRATKTKDSVESVDETVEESEEVEL